MGMGRFTVSINIEKLYEKLLKRGKMHVRVDEVAGYLCISEKSAGRLLSRMAEKGFLEKWGNGIYLLKTNRRLLALRDS
jgi:predicted transcriptional regulator of viral defense system